MNYCQEHQLAPRIDSSNLSLSFFRNRCRLELLPLLRKYNPNVDQALLRLAEIASDDTAFIEQQALQLWDEVAKGEDGVIYLDKKKTTVLPLALQRQLIRLALARILGNTRDIEANHIEAIRALLSKPVGKRISLPHDITCHGEYNEVIIASPPFVIASAAKQSHAPLPLLKGELPLNIPGETVLPGWRVIASISPVVAGRSSALSAPCHSEGAKRPKNLSQGKFREAHFSSVIASAAKQSQSSLVAEFDLEPAGTELFVRQRQSGDSFQPLGMDMPKKLQRFMVDAKIPLSWRDHVPLVCSPRQILWVVGWRIGDRVKVTGTTREILRLEFIMLL